MNHTITQWVDQTWSNLSSPMEARVQYRPKATTSHPPRSFGGGLRLLEPKPFIEQSNRKICPQFICSFATTKKDEFVVNLYLAQFFWSRFRLCESGHPACASELVLGLQNRLHPRLPETSVQQVCCMCAGIGREDGNNTSCVMNTMKNLSQYIKAIAAMHHMQNSHVIRHLNMDRKVVERLTKDTISEATLMNSTAEATLTSKIHQGNKATFFNILLLGWSIDTRRISTTIASGILAYRRPSTASKSNLVTASCHERLKWGWMWNSLLRICAVSHLLHLLPHPSNFKPYAESK